MDFRVIESKKIFAGLAIKLWQDRVEYPDGRKVTIEVLRHPGSVGILPMDDEGQIWFVRQYRHPAGGMLLELPAGTIDDGEAPQITAAREIREEIGMSAKTITPIGGFFLAPGYSTEFMHVFLASGLESNPLSQDEGEYIMAERMPLTEVYRMLDEGKIADGKTVAILGLMRSKLYPRAD